MKLDAGSLGHFGDFMRSNNGAGPELEPQPSLIAEFGGEESPRVNIYLGLLKVMRMKTQTLFNCEMYLF